MAISLLSGTRNSAVTARLRLCLLLLFAVMESNSQTSELEMLAALAALDKFGNAYNKFCATWAKGPFDIHQAKQLSTLWHNVEASGYWPIEENKPTEKEKHK